MASEPVVNSAILTGMLSLPIAKTSISYFLLISPAVFRSLGRILSRCFLALMEMFMLDNWTGDSSSTGTPPNDVSK